MTDYKKTTGYNGTMMIRDKGESTKKVELWFKAGYSSDWVNGLKFSWSAHGDTYSKSINYPTGADWYHVATVTVTYSQYVTFRLVSDTSISGIGGPTTFKHWIHRDTEPDRPSTPRLSSITDDSVYVRFSDGDNGGDAINYRQIGYGTSSSYPQDYKGSDGGTTVSGLSRGRRYYFWARTRNSVGYSNWSGRASAVTLDVPEETTRPHVSNILATSAYVTFSPNGDGGSKILEYEVGYSTTEYVVDGYTVSSDRSTTITGLIPGTKYKIWARAKNSVGWSSWSTGTYITTVAGAYIQVGTERKLAVPYVNVNGVWKLAEPRVKKAGVWERTI